MLHTLPDDTEERDLELGASFAAAVSLVYSSDSEPGITRRRSGRGFCYRDPAGRLIKDSSQLQRIAALAIPPAWKNVWICPTTDGHIQATGRDDCNRKQYRYNSAWTLCRDEVKYAGLTAFARALPRLRDRIDADLDQSGLPRERVLASVVWLLDNAMIRVGNASYARENKSFGLTTLRDRHVAIQGKTLTFQFRGKSGKDWNLKISDPRIARVVRSAQDLPGQHLFQYLDAEGTKRSVRSQDVNDYIRESSGATYTSKHFRTWGGTVRAAQLLAEIELPESKADTARALNAAIDTVSQRLGNTRTVCRKCYIHPRVIETWSAGRLGEELATAKRRIRKTPARLSAEEALVLRWLEAAA